MTELEVLQATSDAIASMVEHKMNHARRFGIAAFTNQQLYDERRHAQAALAALRPGERLYGCESGRGELETYLRKIELELRARDL